MRAGTASSAKRITTRSPSPAAAAERERIAVLAGHERVTPLEGAVRVVGAPRERERVESLQLSLERRAFERLVLSAQDQRMSCGERRPERTVPASPTRASRAAAGAAAAARGGCCAAARGPAPRVAVPARPIAVEVDRAARPANERRSLRARVDVDRDQRVRGVRWSRAADRGDVVDQRAVRLVAHGADHRQTQQRDGATERLVAERPQVREAAAAAADHCDVHRGHGGEVAQRRRDRARRAAVLHGRVGPDDRPAPAASLEPGKQVGNGGAAASRDDADGLGDRGAGEGLLRSEQPVGLERLHEARPGARAGLPRRPAAGR